jgi:hypothetical protein
VAHRRVEHTRTVVLKFQRHREIGEVRGIVTEAGARQGEKEEGRSFSLLPFAFSLVVDTFSVAVAGFDVGTAHGPLVNQIGAWRDSEGVRQSVEFQRAIRSFVLTPSPFDIQVHV